MGCYTHYFFAPALPSDMCALAFFFGYITITQHIQHEPGTGTYSISLSSCVKVILVRYLLKSNNHFCHASNIIFLIIT